MQSLSRALRRNNITIDEKGNVQKVTRKFNNRKMTKARVKSFLSEKILSKSIK